MCCWFRYRPRFRRKRCNSGCAEEDGVGAVFGDGARGELGGEADLLWDDGGGAWGSDVGCLGRLLEEGPGGTGEHEAEGDRWESERRHSGALNLGELYLLLDLGPFRCATALRAVEEIEDAARVLNKTLGTQCRPLG